MISIAMTTYNGEKYLSEQLDSILSQTVTDFELIICDDFSQDKTLSILNEYASKYDKIKVFQNEKNLGFVKNFEKALLLCSGDYIALCDQDDIWTENHLEILLNNMDSFDLCGANAILVDSNNRSLGINLLQQRQVKIIPTTQSDFLERLLYDNIFQGAAVLIKKDLLDKALPIPNEIYHDYWFALMACAGNGIKYVDTNILRYRQHENNVTNNQKFSFVSVVIGFIKNFKYKRQELHISRMNHVKSLELYLGYSKEPEKVKASVEYFSKYPNYNFKFIRCCIYFFKNYRKMYCSNDIFYLIASFFYMMFS